jgi:hypothetical protein
MPFFLPDGFEAGDSIAAENDNPNIQEHQGTLLLPTLAGGVGIVYNLPGSPQCLSLCAYHSDLRCGCTWGYVDWEC